MIIMIIIMIFSSVLTFPVAATFRLTPGCHGRSPSSFDTCIFTFSLSILFYQLSLTPV